MGFATRVWRGTLRGRALARELLVDVHSQPLDELHIKIREHAYGYRCKGLLYRSVQFSILNHYTSAMSLKYEPTRVCEVTLRGRALARKLLVDVHSEPLEKLSSWVMPLQEKSFDPKNLAMKFTSRVI